MPWTVGTFHKKRWYHSPWPWIGAALVASVAFLILPHAQSFYRSWMEGRRIQRAANFFTAGDYKEAILGSRTVLARNPHSIEATRIFAESLEALGSPDSLAARQHLESIGGGNATNSLAIAAAMWKAGNYAGTARTLADMPKEGRETAKFHEFSGRVASRQGEQTSAATHWEQACRLVPTNTDYALEYSGSQLRGTDESGRTAALDRLAKLREQPDTRLAALRILLADSVNRAETSPAITLATELAESPGATFADKLRRLSVLNRSRRTQADEYLTKLQAECVPDPRNVFLVLTWMNENSLALAIPEWRDRLPQEALDLPQIRSALADAEARASNWTRLKESVEKESWKELDFLRYAYLTRATERLGDELGSTAAWANALASAGSQPWPLETLARTVLGWGWTQKANDLLWRLAETGKAPRWAADHLWKSALAAQNTNQLYLAARVIASLDPRSTPARNNYIALALLTGHDADSPHKLASMLFQQAPSDAVVATTYGFSLFQQGQAAEAVTVMKTFPREKLREPNIALYYSVFLTGAGRLAEAHEYLQCAATAPMLPEERTLFAQAGGDPAASAARATTIR